MKPNTTFLVLAIMIYCHPFVYAQPFLNSFKHGDEVYIKVSEKQFENTVPQVYRCFYEKKKLYKSGYRRIVKPEISLWWIDDPGSPKAHPQKWANQLAYSYVRDLTAVSKTHMVYAKIDDTFKGNAVAMMMAYELVYYAEDHLNPLPLPQYSAPEIKVDHDYTYCTGEDKALLTLHIEVTHPADYAGYILDLTKKAFPSMEQHQLRETYLNGHPAAFIHISMQFEKRPARTSVLSYIVPKNGKSYMVQAQCPTPDLPEMEATLRRILSSFQLD